MKTHLLVATAGIVAACVVQTGCSSFTRSEKATHVEDEANLNPEHAQPAANLPEAAPPMDAVKPLDIAPPPQKIQAQPKSILPVQPNPKVKAADESFQNALRSQREGAFGEALERWQKYLSLYAGMPNQDAANYNTAYCLLAIGRFADAVPYLQSTIQDAPSSRNARLQVDARLLLAEAFYQLKDFDQAIALTFELLPDGSAEQAAGIRRSSLPIPLESIQKVRLYILRGRVFTALVNTAKAQTAFDRAAAILGQRPSNSQISQYDRSQLIALLGLRQLENLGVRCAEENQIPERLSEAEFLAYADAYYDCVAPARKRMCEVYQNKDEQIRGPARQAYRAMVEAPLQLRDHLPPPARAIKRRDQVGHYESEMKALIEKTVEERALGFKNLDACGLSNLF